MHRTRCGERVQSFPTSSRAHQNEALRTRLWGVWWGPHCIGVMDWITGLCVDSACSPSISKGQGGVRSNPVVPEGGFLHPQVNLKEQGQLRCRDEFIVCCGRKKYLRHVFLFDDLILFSKTRKVDGGYDIYTYKQSFKVMHLPCALCLWCRAGPLWMRRDHIFVLSCGSLAES